MNPIGVTPQVTEYLYRKATVKGIPLSGTFELTPVCNMDCKMCYIRLSAKQQQAIAPLQSGDKWLALAQRAKEQGLLYLLLTGGEPFLHPDIRKILEGLQPMGIMTVLNSNGTMIDENTVAWLKKCPPARINISIYGADDETYGRLCGNPRGFTQVSHAIELLLAAGISVKLNCSVTPENAHALPKIAEFAKAKGLYLQVAAYMFPPVRKDEKFVGQNARLTPEDAAYYTAYSEYLTLGKERFLAKGCDTPTFPDMDEVCTDAGDGVRCRAGKCSFWVTWQGDLLPCGMFSGENVPNVFEENFNTAWQTVRRQVAEIRLPGKCAGCEAKDVCHACAAMVYTESGNFREVPKYRCDMIHSYPTQWQRVKEEIL